MPFTSNEYSEQLEDLFKLSFYARSDGHVALYKEQILPRLKQKSCAKMDKQELHIINKLLGSLVFYSHDTDLTKMRLFCFNQLNKIEKQNKKAITRIYNYLYSERLFDEAKEFYNKHSALGVEMLPHIIDVGKKPVKYSVLTVDSTRENTFLRKSFDYSDYDGIIVNTTPLCGFSQYLISELSKDKGLSLFMMNNSTWLSFPGRAQYFQAMVDWKQKYPYAEISIIENISDFKTIEYEGTPTMFFLKNGEVKDTLVGWPKEGRMTQLKQLIKKHYSVDLN
ncbi:MAG: hypothetical protein L3J53_01160 [Proteobacteria bacterium]|nr:hypothetical protein [Pseudomonadota bacterium]